MVNQSVIANHLFLSQAAVSQLVCRLGLDLASLSLDEVRQRYLDHLRAVASGRDGSSDIAAERLALTRAKRVAAEFANQREAGTLCYAADVQRGLATISARMRQALERIPDRVAPRLAAESDEATVHGLLADEIEATLTDFAAELRSYVASQGAAPRELKEGAHE